MRVMQRPIYRTFFRTLYDAGSARRWADGIALFVPLSFGEQHDVSSLHPEWVVAMKMELIQWIETCRASFNGNDYAEPYWNIFMKRRLRIKVRMCACLLAAFAAAPFNGLAGEATLYRDTWGVPHIWADDHVSAGYAVGQAQCEDSLANVVYCLHAGVGRLAEFVGPSMLSADIKARKLRHRAFSEAAWLKLSPPLRELVEGYCAGVNDYLESHPKELPRRVENVTPVQVLAWHRALLMMSTVAISKADAEASKSDGYHPKYNAQRAGQSGLTTSSVGKSDQHPGIAPGKSNSWALSGAKTTSGAPMLLIVPHISLENHFHSF